MQLIPLVGDTISSSLKPDLGLLAETFMSAALDICGYPWKEGHKL